MAGEYQVRLSSFAKKDVRSIIHYLMTTYSKQTALDVVNAINEKVDTLSFMPSRHPKFEKPGLKVEEELRWVAVKKYQIIFRIERVGTQITVSRIFGAGMSDWEKIARIEEE